MWNKMDSLFSSGTIRLFTVCLFCSIVFASGVDNSELSIVSDKNDSVVSPNGLGTAANASSESVNKSYSSDDGLTNPIIPFLPKRETDKFTSTTLSGGITTTMTTTTTTKPPTTEASTTTTTTATTTTTTPKVDATTFDTEGDTTTVTNAPSTTLYHINTDKATSFPKINHVTTTVQEMTTPSSTIRSTSAISTVMQTKTPKELLTTSADSKTPDSMTTKRSTFKQTTKALTTIKNTQKSVSIATSIITKSSTKSMTHITDKPTISPTEFVDPIKERLHDNSTIDQVNSTTEDPMRIIVIYSEDDFMSLDSFWPIALALTIGIPCIIVMAVTITVLYRRRTANPRSRLSMYAGHDYSTM